MLKLEQWRGKDKWLILLTVGAALCILALPAGRLPGGLGSGSGQNKGGVPESGEAAPGRAQGAEDAGRAAEASSYEKQLETRVRELLARVDGVGGVDVLIVLKSSSEKVWQTDVNSRSSVTEERQEHVSRSQVSREEERTTVQQGTGGEQEPMLVKELTPEISGIVISADGGKSPAVRQEISSAMEALFGLPAHKIKVLKRVE